MIPKLKIIKISKIYTANLQPTEQNRKTTKKEKEKERIQIHFFFFITKLPFFIFNLSEFSMVILQHIYIPITDYMIT